MKYDEDLLVELIAGDVSQTEIAEKVGVSRRTVWRIANGHSRPDLQRKIADTVEGYRQATIRMAAKHMKPLLEKQIKVALEGDGEISRRCREFLLKMFMMDLPAHAAKAAAKRERAPDADRQLDGVALYNGLVELSPELKEQVVKELRGPAEETVSLETTTCHDVAQRRRKPTAKTLTTEDTEDTEVEKATVSPSPLPTANCPLPTAKPLGKGKKEVPPPFSTKVTLPDGTRIYRETLRIIAEAEAEAATIKPRRRVPRAPSKYHFP